MRYLWDTNTAIYYLQQQFPLEAERLMDEIVISNQPSLSAITEIELLCWKTNNENDIKLMRNFLQDSWVIELEQPVKMKTVELRKNLGIKLPDAIIAATALVHNLILISRNTRDFKNVPDLQLLNVFDAR